MGFSIKTAKTFGISVGKSMKLAINDEDKDDTNIYGVLVDKTDDKTAYKISKAGEYHSVNAKAFLDEIEMKYDGGIPLSVSEQQIEGMKVLKFTKRDKKSKGGKS